MTGVENITNLPNQNKNIEKQNQVNSNKTENSKQVESQKSSTESSKSASQNKSNSIQDKVDISQQARQAKNTSNRNEIEVEEYVQQLKGLKTASKDKLKSVHKNIESGKYSDSKVLEEIVNSMVDQSEVGVMQETGTAEAAQQSQPAESSGSETISETEVNEIQQNIENGKYESEQVLDTIVDSMINPELF